MRGAVAIEVMGGDLDDIEAEPGDFLHVFQAIGAPLLLPVRVVIRISIASPCLNESALAAHACKVGSEWAPTIWATTAFMLVSRVASSMSHSLENVSWCLSGFRNRPEADGLARSIPAP